MKIDIIKPHNTNFITNRKSNINCKNTAKYEYDKLAQSSYPMGYVNINFRGKSIEKLWEEYNWYINNDRTSAIYSFLKIKESPEIMDKFLTSILETTDRSRELLSSIVYNPRETKNITLALRSILPANSANLLTFLPNSSYGNAYNNFVEWKVNEAHSIEELLKMRPDWRGEVLLQKYESLKGNRNLEIGNIPKEIPSEHLDKILEYLKEQMEFGVKYKKKIKDLEIDNRVYQFAFFAEGKSDKNVFGLFTPEGKKYVLKMGIPESRSLDAPFALGTLAKIDSYMTFNRSRNSAPLCYYNYEKNFSIYKYIEHIPTTFHSKNLTEIANNMPDFGTLGLSYNDTVGEKNYFLMDTKSNVDLYNTEGFQEGVQRKEWISVDNDHVTYGNILQPSVTKYHAPLPNAMGMFN